MSAKDTSGSAPQHGHPHNNTMSGNEKFWVDQVTPPPGERQGVGNDNGGGGVISFPARTYKHRYVQTNMHAYIHSHSHSHNHLSCRLLEVPGISHRQVVPTLLDPMGPRAALRWPTA